MPNHEAIELITRMQNLLNSKPQEFPSLYWKNVGHWKSELESKIKEIKQKEKI